MGNLAEALRTGSQARLIRDESHSPRIVPKNWNLAERVRKRSTALIRTLNDQHIFVSKALPLLETNRKELAESTSEKDRKYSVPSRKKTGVARRTDAELKRIFDEYLDRELFATSLIAAVSRTEDFILDALRMVLREYPERLELSLQGNRAARGSELTVPLSDVLAADDLGEIINGLIARRLGNASYAAPRDYLQYLGSVVRMGVSSPEFEEYIEIKATRDLLVHNSGVVNETYLEKAGKAKRAKLGKLIPVNRAYYDSSIAILKKVANHVSDGVRLSGGDSE